MPKHAPQATGTDFFAREGHTLAGKVCVCVCTTNVNRAPGARRAEIRIVPSPEKRERLSVAFAVYFTVYFPLPRALAPSIPEAARANRPRK